MIGKSRIRTVRLKIDQKCSERPGFERKGSKQNRKARKGLCAIDCTRNNLSLNYDSGTENTALLQIFTKNSTKRKHGELTANVLLSLIIHINYDFSVKFTKLCTIDCTRTNLSYFYSTTNKKWNSSN